MTLKYRVQRHELQSEKELRITLTGIGHVSDVSIIRPIEEAPSYPVGSFLSFEVTKEG